MASSVSSCRTSSVCATAVAVGLGAIALYKVYKGLSYISQPQHSQLVKLSRSKQKRAPPCESPLFKDRYFENAQGLWLYKRFWAHQGTQRVGCVFISHGYGEHCGRYHHVAVKLTSLGFDVFAMDHQGHGQSEGDHAYMQSFQHYVDDLVHFVQHTRKARPELNDCPTFLLGHSMGALISFNAVLKTQPLWSGVVLCGTALIPDAKVATPSRIAIFRIISNLFPKWPLKALSKIPPCNNKVATMQKQADPMVYHGRMRARWGYEMLQALRRTDTDEVLSKFTAPLLLIHGTEDHISTVESSRRLNKAVGSSDKTLREYEGLQHELFNEVEYDTVLTPMCSWLVAHASKAPVTE